VNVVGDRRFLPNGSSLARGLDGVGWACWGGGELVFAHKYAGMNTGNRYLTKGRGSELG